MACQSWITFFFIHPVQNKLRICRQIQLQRLKETAEFDVLVIGGGATGCGVALDAVTRGWCYLTGSMDNLHYRLIFDLSKKTKFLERIL